MLEERRINSKVDYCMQTPIHAQHYYPSAYYIKNHNKIWFLLTEPRAHKDTTLC